MTLEQWQIEWAVPYGAIVALRTLMGFDGGHHIPPALKGRSEAAVESVVVLEAARNDCRLFKNSSGALKDANGRLMRFGLGNTSKDANTLLKTADRIGWRRRLITQAMVGTHLAQFLSREIKHADWHYTGDEHEQAQVRWAQLVIADGGDAGFATGEGTI